MIINPVTITMPKHELEALLDAGRKRLGLATAKRLDRHASATLEYAVDSLEDTLKRYEGVKSNA